MAPKKPEPPVKKSKFEIVRTIQLRDDVVEGEIVSREAPLQRSENFNKGMVIQPVLNDAQLSIMLNKTPSWAVKQRQGGGGKVYTYVPHGYVTDTLNKAFGFDWDLILDPMFDGRMYAMEIEEISDRSGKVTKTNRHMAICGHLTVRVHDPHTHAITATITKSGFGSQMWLPSMELGDALKGARSDLLKTCAYQLGIALDLYWNERAEINDFETAQREAVQLVEDEKKLGDLIKSGIPTNFATLLSKSNSEYGFSGDDIEKILDATLDEIMDYVPQEFASSWNSIISAGSKKEGK